MIALALNDQGEVMLNGDKLDHADAVELAALLCIHVQDSIYRNQTGTARYHSAAGILERQESKLGQAIVACREVYNQKGA